MKVLFVTWDGPQTAYLEGLFSPIFRGLAERGYRFHVVQFTWADRERIAQTESACAELGVTYESYPILRRPVAPGAFWTAFRGARPVARAIEKYDIDVVLPRSTLPALATMRALRHHPGLRMVLDADGLPHDERVDFGGWSSSDISYRILRDMEAQAVRRSDAILTRSSRAVDILVARAGPGVSPHKFHRVGNGRDEQLFAPATVEERESVRRELGVESGAPLLVYAGSVGPQYYPNEMMGIFARLRAKRADARFLLLTGSLDQAKELMDAHADLASSCIVERVAPDQVGRLVAAADAGLALRRPTFSMQAVAPIKLGEYLLCGVPVIASAGIGDTDQYLSESTGFTVQHADPAELDAAARWVLDTAIPNAERFRRQCREAGLAHFGLSATVAAYARALGSVG